MQYTENEKKLLGSSMFQIVDPLFSLLIVMGGVKEWPHRPLNVIIRN